MLLQIQLLVKHTDVKRVCSAMNLPIIPSHTERSVHDKHKSAFNAT